LPITEYAHQFIDEECKNLFSSKRRPADMEAEEEEKIPTVQTSTFAGPRAPLMPLSNFFKRPPKELAQNVAKTSKEELEKARARRVEDKENDPNAAASFTVGRSRRGGQRK